jgi:hypothetical protein
LTIDLEQYPSLARLQKCLMSAGEAVVARLDNARDGT